MILPAFHRIQYRDAAYDPTRSLFPTKKKTIILGHSTNVSPHMEALNFTLIGYHEQSKRVEIIIFDLEELDRKFQDLGALDIEEELTHPWEPIRAHGLERLKNAK